MENNLRQIKFSLEDFVSNGDSALPDAVMSPEDLHNIKVLAGINKLNYASVAVVENNQKNISHTAMERATYMKQHNIQPGTDAWFRLWFSKPYLTGDTGMDK